MDLQFLGATGTVSGSKYLVRNGFQGRILCTEATYELCKVLLPDSARLQEEEAEYANRKAFSKHHPALPLYTERDAQLCLKRFSAVAFGQVLDLGGIKAELLPAGHLLGAAMIMLRSGQSSLLFSGDLGRPGDVFMRAPVERPPSDYLVLESTYGNREHPADDPADKLAEVVNRTLSRQGVLLIPSFAVGRAQALLHLLSRLKAARRIPDVPVYVNSPMAADATRIYLAHHTEHRLSMAECRQLEEGVRFVHSVEESKALNRRRGPMIIIAGSGMATGGRIIHHLKSFAADARNAVLFTGYQAGGTRGAAMLGGASSIKIHGEYVPVRAEAAMIENLSAHADAREILQWLRTCTDVPRCTYLTHGEPLAADALRLRIQEELRWNCLVPDFQERLNV